MFIWRTMTIVFSLSLVSSPLCARIVKTTSLAGWYDIFNDDKKYLSPFNGYIAFESEYCKNMYEYGYIEAEEATLPTGEVVVTRVKGGDPIIVLVHTLFHKVGNHFAATADNRYPAAYLTAQDIGKIIATIEKIAPETTVTEKDADALYSTFITIIKNAITKSQSPSNINLVNMFTQLQKFSDNEKIILLDKTKYRYAKTKPSLYVGKNISIQEWTQLLHNAKEGTINNILKDCPQECSQLLENAWKTIKQQNNDQAELSHETKAALEKSELFAKTIVAALKECGYISIKGESLQPSFPVYTVHTLFLALLYALSETTNSFFEYLSELGSQDAILKQNYTGILQTKKLESQISIFDLGEQFNQMQSVNRQESLAFITKNFEQIALSYLLFRPFYLPPFTKVSEKDITFSACNENSSLNWACVLMRSMGLFDEKTQRYETNPARIKTVIEQKYGIKLANSTLLPSFVKILEEHDNQGDISSQSRLQKYTNLISNLPGIKYLRYFHIPSKKSAKLQSFTLSPFFHAPQNERQASFFNGFPTNTDPVINEDFFLFELAGYPSSFIETLNQIFGFDFNSMESLVSGLKLTPLDNKLGEFSDIKNLSTTQLSAHIQIIIGAIAYRVTIVSAPGHATFLVGENAKLLTEEHFRQKALHIATFCSSRIKNDVCAALFPVFGIKGLQIYLSYNYYPSQLSLIAFSLYLEDYSLKKKAISLLANGKQKQSACSLLKTWNKKIAHIENPIEFSDLLKNNIWLTCEDFDAMDLLITRYKSLDAKAQASIFKFFFQTKPDSEINQHTKLKNLFLPALPHIKNYEWKTSKELKEMKKSIKNSKMAIFSLPDLLSIWTSFMATHCAQGIINKYLAVNSMKIVQKYSALKSQDLRSYFELAHKETTELEGLSNKASSLLPIIRDNILATLKTIDNPSQLSISDISTRLVLKAFREIPQLELDENQTNIDIPDMQLITIAIARIINTMDWESLKKQHEQGKL